MSAYSRLVRGGALVALLLTAACASGGTRTNRQERAVAHVQVENNVLPPRGATIRVVSVSGPRAILGVVSAGRTTGFSYDQAGFQGMYFLLAEVDGGASVRSRNIALRDGSRLRWELQTNSLTEVD